MTPMAAERNHSSTEFRGKPSEQIKTYKFSLCCPGGVHRIFDTFHGEWSSEFSILGVADIKIEFEL